ncbi:ABC transporter ATP-binding protein [Kitasatospora sp. GP82]|uniref:ABC transporter ATP-binding protein n=1 Tax=Kitasatospora sp. GP82 TaxID=3035089 RepID=UPI00247576B3|nr:ABC transporter ATP-binding protein [Kitasatospora sp. GP82]MDH6123599.1 ATP-binding cassette subfamily B protein [Kitasatospora sp. GP82]
MEEQAATQTPVSVRRVFGLFRPHLRRVALMLLLVVLSSAVAMVSPFLLRKILDVALPQGRTGLLSLLAGAMIAVTAISGMLGVFQSYMSTVIGQLIMSDLRSAVYSHLQRLSLAFFTRTHTGEVQSRIANDIGGMDAIVTSLITSLVGSAATVAASLTAMVLLDWRLSLASLAILPIFIWVNRRVGKERRALVEERQQQMAVLSTLVEETLSISGFLLGRLMGRSRDLTERFSKESKTLGNIAIRTTMAGRWRQSGLQVVVAAMPVLIYWTAGLVSGHGSTSITVGTLVAFTTLQQSLLNPAVQLIQLGAVVQGSFSLFGRVFEYLDLPEEVPEPRNPVLLQQARGDLKFENVSFSYGDDLVLRDITIDVPAGTSLAVVGPTGAGKSTLGYLALRLYDATIGRVTIDGVDVKDLDFATIARNVGMVSQDTHLFHASVAENLRFGKPDATDAELIAAAELAQIHQLIQGLPDGYDTIVGERGYRFSGGEKQRLAIARTMLRNPPILLLDEATSALDTRTERAVQEALAELAKNRTTITIAHRLSTIENADQIVVLGSGRVLEQGTHTSLGSLGGEYSALLAGISRAATVIGS